MLVLGINAHHADAAAALYADGRLVAAVAEERLNRIKHCAGFPALAAAEVLRIAGVSLADLDEVGIARDSRANLVAKAGYVLKHLGGIGKVAKKRIKDRAGLAGLEEQLCEALGAPRGNLRAKVRRVEHHVSHAASAFLCSPFERAAVLTLDGFGDFASCLAAVGESSRLKPLWRVTYPHSLGILYTAICQFIGYDRYGDEGKVMGLAPYGEPKYAAFFERLLRFKAGGRFELDLSYFNHHTEGVRRGLTNTAARILNTCSRACFPKSWGHRAHMALRKRLPSAIATSRLRCNSVWSRRSCTSRARCTKKPA